MGQCILGELLILDEDGNECPTGTSGTVWFRGATSFEYYNAPDKTAESRQETDKGVMSTVGDVGYLDFNGSDIGADGTAWGSFIQDCAASDVAPPCGDGHTHAQYGVRGFAGRLVWP